MKKRFFAMYALVGALVASPIFTSCVDDTVSDSVEALRNANTEYKKAQTAQIEANIAINQAAATLAQEAQRIANELAAAELAHTKAMNAYEEALKEATNAQAIEEARIALEKALRDEEIAKAKAEAELEKAKLEAENIIKGAQLEHLKAEQNLANYIKGLDAAKKLEANKLNGNIDAIMNGGWYYVFDGYNWNQNRYYSSSYYSSNDYNSIIALNQGLINEKVNLHNLQNGLVDIEEWMAEEKLDQEAEIAKQEALVAKYTELAKSSNLEAAEKAYKEAEDKLAVIEARQKELALEEHNASTALTAYKNGMQTNAIAKAISDWYQQDYLTAKEREEYKDTITYANNFTSTFSRDYEAVYEHTAEDAEELAEYIAGIQKEIDKKNEAIEAKKEEIAELEANMAKVNATDLQREAAIAKAKVEELQKAFDDVLASEAYKTKVAALEKAVADAQAAFNKAPTSFTEPQFNDDGTPKLDADGIQEVKYGTKELLQQAEAALKNVIEYNNYNYGTEAEPKWLYDLYNDLHNNYVDVRVWGPIPWGELDDYYYNYWDDHYYADGWISLAEKLNYGVECVKFYDENNLDYMADDLEYLNDDLEYYTEQLEKWKEFQATLADSKVWEEYAEMCKAKAELETAIFTLEIEENELNSNYNYYDQLKSTLFGFVGDENNAGSLPNYAELIETAEEAIKTAKEAIAELEYDNTQGENKLNQEAAIAKKEAEIAAIEAELEIRQAEYDAEMAELKALVGAEEETPAE